MWQCVVGGGERRFRKLLRLLSGTNETILDVLWVKMEEREIMLLGLLKCIR